jgi:hypothetical protein
MKDKPELFSDLPPIPDAAAIGSGYVFKPCKRDDIPSDESKIRPADRRPLAILFA